MREAEISRTKTLRADESGIYLVLVAIMVVTLFLVIGVGIDGGRLYLSRLDQQRSADAGALSGAYFIGSGLSATDIADVSLRVAQDNFSANGVPFNQGNLAGHFTVDVNLAAQRVGVLAETGLESFIMGKVVEGPVNNLVRVDAAAVRQNVAVDLLLDITGSMGEVVPNTGGLTKMQLAVAAAKNFVDHFNQSDRVGLVTYSEGTNIRYSIVNPYNSGALKSIIDDLPLPDGLTNISVGLTAALYDMKRLDPVQFPNRVIVLVTDGVNNLNNRDNWYDFRDPQPDQQVADDIKDVFPTYPDRPEDAACSGTDVQRQHFVDSMTAANFIRAHGIKVITVAVGQVESAATITEEHPWGQSPIFGSDARIRPNFMRWLANDGQAASDNNDLGFPTECSPNYDDPVMADGPQGIGLISPDATALDGMLQTVASYLTLQIVE